MRIWVFVELIADQKEPEITLYLSEEAAYSALQAMFAIYEEDGAEWVDTKELNETYRFACDQYEGYLMWLPVV